VLASTVLLSSVATAAATPNRHLSTRSVFDLGCFANARNDSRQEGAGGSSSGGGGRVEISDDSVDIVDIDRARVKARVVARRARGGDWLIRE
jgi:hypothetical protein